MCLRGGSTWALSRGGGGWPDFFVLFHVRVCVTRQKIKNQTILFWRTNTCVNSVSEKENLLHTRIGLFVLFRQNENHRTHTLVVASIVSTAEKICII